MLTALFATLATAATPASVGLLATTPQIDFEGETSQLDARGHRAFAPMGGGPVARSAVAGPSVQQVVRFAPTPVRARVRENAVLVSVDSAEELRAAKRALRSYDGDVFFD